MLFFPSRMAERDLVQEGHGVQFVVAFEAL